MINLVLYEITENLMLSFTMNQDHINVKYMYALIDSDLSLTLHGQCTQGGQINGHKIKSKLRTGKYNSQPGWAIDIPRVLCM